MANLQIFSDFLVSNLHMWKNFCNFASKIGVMFLIHGNPFSLSFN